MSEVLAVEPPGKLFKGIVFEDVTDETEGRVDELLDKNPSGKYPFGVNIGIIDSILYHLDLNNTPRGFKIFKKLDKGSFNLLKENKAGENTGALRVYVYSILRGLKIGEALKLFSEHFRNVVDTPNGDNHANIRAVMENDYNLYVADVVRIDGINN